MRYGYENIKNIKCGKLSLTEKNKTVDGIYLDITDKFENIANACAVFPIDFVWRMIL